MAETEGKATREERACNRINGTDQAAPSIIANSKLRNNPKTDSTLQHEKGGVVDRREKIENQKRKEKQGKGGETSRNNGRL